MKFFFSEVLFVNGYVRAEDLTKKWNVTVRQIQMLCKAGKIDGAVKFGTTWAIPEDALKPTRSTKFKPGRKPKKSNQDEGPKN
ncbi:MAG: DNA-binding protein [Deltaproteobacteria bacterium]|jgi:hypothetical protein|nr:DNA-binding protein [Deltaproteobacteria bacterium]